MATDTVSTISMEQDRSSLSGQSVSSSGNEGGATRATASAVGRATTTATLRPAAAAGSEATATQARTRHSGNTQARAGTGQPGLGARTLALRTIRGPNAGAGGRTLKLTPSNSTGSAVSGASSASGNAAAAAAAGSPRTKQEMAAWGDFHKTMKRTTALANHSGNDLQAWNGFAANDVQYLLADHGTELHRNSFGGDDLNAEQLAAWSDFGNTNNAQQFLGQAERSPSLPTSGDFPFAGAGAGAGAATDDSASMDSSDANHALRSSIFVGNANARGLTLRAPAKTMRGASPMFKPAPTILVTTTTDDQPPLSPSTSEVSALSGSVLVTEPLRASAIVPGASVEIELAVEAEQSQAQSASATADGSATGSAPQSITVPDDAVTVRESSSYATDATLAVTASAPSVIAAAAAAANGFATVRLPSRQVSQSMATTDASGRVDLFDMQQAKSQGEAALHLDGDEFAATADLPMRHFVSTVLGKVTGTMPQSAKWCDRFWWAHFIDSCLRGYGQILFMNNPISGLFFLAAIFVHSRYYGVCSIIGALCSTGIAYFLSLNRASIRSGLFGFNGVLCAVGVALFQNADVEGWDNWLLYIPIVIIPTLSTLIVVVIGNILVRHFGLATFTLPFHAATWMWLLGSQVYAYFPSQGAAAAPYLQVPTTGADITPISYDIASVFKVIGYNIAQVFFLENHISGYIIVAGTAVCSRISAVMCVYGSILAILMSLALGVPVGQFYAGLWGFNPVIVAVAIGGMFYVLSARVFALSTAGTIMSVFVHGAVSSMLRPIGLPALTFPSAVTSLAFCLMAGAIPGAVPVELSRMTVPEDHLRRQRLAERVLSRFAAVRSVSRQLNNGASAHEQQFLEQLFVPLLLCWAAATGDVQTVAELIELGADPNVGDMHSGRTCLHLAAAEGQLEVVRFLISRGSHVNQVDVHGNTPLDDAIASQQPATVALALCHNGGVHNTPASPQARTLCEEVALGATDKVARLLQLGYDVNVCDLYDQRTALHVACSMGHPSLVMVLLSCGASIYNKDRYGQTPVDNARTFGHEKLATWVAAEGERIAASKRRPIQRGRSTRQLKVVAAPAAVEQDEKAESIELIALQKSRNPQFQRKATLATIAPVDQSHGVKTSSSEDVHEEEELEVRPAVCSQELLTSDDELAFAVDILQALLLSQDEVALKALGPALLSASALSNSTEFLTIMLEMGVNPNLSDYDKTTALHMAAGAGNLNAVKALIYFGADVNATNRWNQTPLDRAVLCHCTLTEGVLSLLHAQERRINMHESAAASSSHTLELVRFLVARGAVLGLASRPMSLASELCDLVMVASASCRSDPRHSAETLERAQQDLSLWTIAGADLSAAEYDGRTCLHLACAEGQAKLVDALLVGGANPLLRDRWGHTPIDEARANGHAAIAARLDQLQAAAK
ncbi:hypothetical protein CAOG_00074 [Capsaspora owczarzaki ATCC 30864]|uniref:Uncharacterized protein n=1 Tax=Capsaspora owczarzaki (strain ATCC 30864) TaxID=595528 RepID=A0A0D2TZQ6_CAPO3|nr:hypothetical protein CAOG_00074 [Capsaspora owczarzaki ATCC 30864]KJE88416.1 hypothetical protein CAOG_000074 [Capsaspora owczarzaki ATCC 30864]|eukprot:XP_004364945.2 hypothetical protein CAOG_00074 [Capsaspora owczarzaki ATCC 30864]